MYWSIALKNMKRVLFKITNPFVPQDGHIGAMEAKTIQHRRSSTSQKGRGNFLNVL